MIIDLNPGTIQPEAAQQQLAAYALAEIERIITDLCKPVGGMVPSGAVPRNIG